MRSEAQRGRFGFSQCADNGNIHVSFTVQQVIGGFVPCNIQIPVEDAERLATALQESLTRHREQLRNRIVRLEDTIRSTELLKTQACCALQHIVDSVPQPGEDAVLTTSGYNLACAAIAAGSGSPCEQNP